MDEEAWRKANWMIKMEDSNVVRPTLVKES